MITFLLYLLESTLCLSILFGVYLLFFRKETFFAFNRIYLLGIMVFSLIIPVVHVSVSWKRIEAFEAPVLEIQSLKSYYSWIIAMTDPEFKLQNNQSSFLKAFEEFPEQGLVTTSSNNNYSGGASPANELSSVSHNSHRYFGWITIIRWVYLTGIALFFFRLVGLFFWLMKTIRNNSYILQGRFKIVQLREEIPPFSFFRYVFVNKDVYDKKDFLKILDHEITHIRQLHSFDLILAHSLSILQWFNPLVWQLQKAIKTNHEYLADKQVVDQGHELFDYQSLLLTQLISIRSVELVNNFNLLSIQKRIAMMTQVKSGFAAKLKVLLIVPFAIVLFLFFADMTFYNGSRSFSNFIELKSANELSNFQGIWENLDKESFGRILAINENTLSILENEFDLKQYKASMTKTTISLQLWPGEVLEIAYSYKGNILQVWWSDNESSQYKKTKYNNSLEFSIGAIANDIDLPVIEEYVEVDWPEYYNIVYTGEKLQVGDQLGTIRDVGTMIEKQKKSLNKLSMKRMTVKLFIDKNVLMEDLDAILLSLRKNDFLKIAYMAQPADNKGSVLLAHIYGRTFKLPPMEGVKLLSDEEVKEQGIDLFTIKVMDKSSSPEEMRPELKKFITNSKKYIIPIEYNETTKYSDVLSFYDLVFGVVYELRDEYAVQKYNTKFEGLSEDHKMSVMSQYPITVVLKNINENADDFGVKR
jgi:biopolymer transport protein ExbD